VRFHFAFLALTDPAILQALLESHPLLTLSEEGSTEQTVLQLHRNAFKTNRGGLRWIALLLRRAAMATSLQQATSLPCSDDRGLLNASQAG
jgi:hypothetical protein